MGDPTDTQAPQGAPAEPKPRRFPTAFTVLAIVLLAVWGLSFVIPSGTYEVDPNSGGPNPGPTRSCPRATTSRRARVHGQIGL